MENIAASPTRGRPFLGLRMDTLICAVVVVLLLAASLGFLVFVVMNEKKPETPQHRARGKSSDSFK